MKNNLKVLDLFSGIGGFSLGLENTGNFVTTKFCEIEDFPAAVIKKNWPGVPLHRDIKTLKVEKSEFDLICGGFPCQNISTQGKQEGLKGDRSKLWKEFFRVIKEGEPRYVIVENVANLRNKGLGKVLKDLWTIGYEHQWHIIPASAVGAFHRRERLWIIAYPECKRSQRSWKCFNAIDKKKDRYREASDVINAFQKKQLPFLCRRHDGLPKRLDRDRLKSLGNAVDPGIVEEIGKIIYKWELGKQS